jgi:peroxiredoxin
MTAGQPPTPDKDWKDMPAEPRALGWKLVVLPLLAAAVLLGAGVIVRQHLAPSSLVPSTGTTAGSWAPTFALPATTGSRFSLAAQRGHPVVLFFMAAWCTSCLVESHALGDVQRAHGDSVRAVLIDIGRGDSAQALRSFVQRSRGPNRYWIQDPAGKVATQYRVQTLDTTYVVDKTGHIAYTSTQPMSDGDLNRVVRQVL